MYVEFYHGRHAQILHTCSDIACVSPLFLFNVCLSSALACTAIRPSDHARVISLMHSAAPHALIPAPPKLPSAISPNVTRTKDLLSPRVCSSAASMMVTLHVKTADEKNQFLFETQTQTTVANLQNELVQIHNLRLKALQLCDACRGLAAHGPLRSEATRGLTEEVAKLSDLDIYVDGEPTNPDPTGYRNGVAPSPEMAKVLETTAETSVEALSHKKVLMNQPLTLRQVKAAFENLRGAVMIVYPAYYKLPEWDPARVILEEEEQKKEESAIVTDTLLPDRTALWWAGKELSPGALLSSYIGRNEKTKIIARLQPKGAGAPIREPRIDAETHKAMLAYCHRKRQEAEAAEEDDDDSYLDSAWADPRALKNMLVGGGRDIKWKP